MISAKIIQIEQVKFAIGNYDSNEVVVFVVSINENLLYQMMELVDLLNSLWGLN